MTLKTEPATGIKGLIYWFFSSHISKIICQNKYDWNVSKKMKENVANIRFLPPIIGKTPIVRIIVFYFSIPNSISHIHQQPTPYDTNLLTNAPSIRYGIFAAYEIWKCNQIACKKNQLTNDINSIKRRMLYTQLQQ